MRDLRLLLLSSIMPILISCPLAGQLSAEPREAGKPEQGVTVKQQRQEEMTHQTVEQQMELRQKGHEGPLPPNAMEEKSQEKSESKTGLRRFLGIAWQYCNRGEFSRAIEIFSTLASDPATQWEAKYGLAMCYARSQDAKKAIPLLEELIGKKLHLKDTLPTLLALLVEGKDYGKAATYLQLLASRERERWEETIRTGTLLAAFEQVKAADKFDELVELIRTHNDLLARCLSPEVFLEAANGLVGRNNHYAKETYTQLLRACPRKWDIRLGILYALKSVLPPADTLLELEREERRTDLEPAYRMQLTDIMVAVFREQLAAAPSDALEVEPLARAILSLKPEDKGALSSLAWWAFNRGEYEQAAEGFTTLVRRFPEELDYAYGLANALVKLKRTDQALALAEQLQGRDKRFAALETDILMESALTIFNERRYAEAERSFESLLARRPDHLDAKRLLAWSIYHQKRAIDALPLFLSLFQVQEDPTIANTILDIYTTSLDRRRAAAFANVLAQSEKRELNKVAGDFLFRNGLAVRAAATYCDPDTCYYNADAPHVEASSYYRRRSGSNGLSRLTDYVFPLELSYAMSSGTEVGLSLTTHHLSSGDATLSEVLNDISGSIGTPLNLTADAFRGLTHQFTTSASVVTPEISLAREELESSYRLTLGVTPLVGTVAPLPTFVAERGTKEWTLNIHQTSVTDSLLSYVGIHAKVPSIPQVSVRLLPTDLEWGRVVKTGIEGEWRATQMGPNWLSVRGGYDFYHGKKVIDNHAYRGSIAAGRTFTAERWMISPGLHFTMQHFAYSTNFFVPGHGGYFSPDTHYISGPFVNLQTEQCKTFLVKGQFGINYFSARSNGAAADPLGILGLSEQIRFSRSSSSGMGFAMNLNGQILLGNHWSLGGTVEANKAADFTEVKAGINLQYFFEPRSKLLQSDTIP
jgi:tetratricopeptide (TPR) repeat protein